VAGIFFASEPGRGRRGTNPAPAGLEAQSTAAGQVLRCLARMKMKLSRIHLMALAGCLAAATAGAQEQPPSPPNVAPAQPPVTAPTRSAREAEAREWVPRGIAELGQNAASRTEFTIDHSMLVLASKLDRDNEDLRRVIAGVNGVSVHSFHYPGAVIFDPMTMNSLMQEYREAGFQHLVSKHHGESGMTTDLWLRMDGSSIRDVAVLWVGARDMNFVTVSGSITPLDLLRLSGHFGIPKMDDGVAVPLPRRDR